MVTLDGLRAICPHTPIGRLAVFLEPLNEAMREFDIDTPAREVAFLAQVAHESGGFRYVRELASGEAYEGRADLGNTKPGDGKFFRGRGLIQLTGRANAVACSKALGVDFVSTPGLLEEPINAARSAAWFWKENDVNRWADAGDFDGVSDAINRGHKTARIGDANGYADRLEYYNRALKVL